jgi:hypothetical protein
MMMRTTTQENTMNRIRPNTRHTDALISDIAIGIVLGTVIAMLTLGVMVF